jgi:hypothetical protein
MLQSSGHGAKSLRAWCFDFALLTHYSDLVYRSCAVDQSRYLIGDIYGRLNILSLLDCEDHPTLMIIPLGEVRLSGRSRDS